MLTAAPPSWLAGAAGPLPASGRAMTGMAGDVIPEIVFVVGGIAVLGYALFTSRRRQARAAVAALAALVVTVVAAVVTAMMPGGAQRLTVFDTYARDGAAEWAKLIVLLPTAGVIALSVRWFERDARQPTVVRRRPSTGRRAARESSDDRVVCRRPSLWLTVGHWSVVSVGPVPRPPRRGRRPSARMWTR